MQHTKDDSDESVASSTAKTLPIHEMAMLLPPPHPRPPTTRRTTRRSSSQRRSASRPASVFQNIFSVSGTSMNSSLSEKKPSRRRSIIQSSLDKKTNQPTTSRSATGGQQKSTATQAPSVASVASSAAHGRRHSFWCSMLNPRSKKWQASAYKALITTVIGFDLFCFIVSTDPTVAQWPHSDMYFQSVEGTVSIIFLGEYMLRLSTITEHRRYGRHGVWRGRVLYATTTVAAWIDVCATLPFFLEQITGLSLPTLTVLRLVRLVRILKTAPYVKAMDAVYRVVYFNAEILYVALLVCFFLTLGTAVLLYVLRPPDLMTDETTSEFTSIPATLYLSIALLTGQGGPNNDAALPWYTKAVVVLTSLVSVAMFAIPASMLTWGWEAEAARMAKRARRRAVQQKSRAHLVHQPATHSSSSSSSGDGETTDDEYFRLIAGEGDDSDDTDQKHAEWMKQVRKAFDQADRDGTGTLTLSETAQLMASTMASVSPSQPNDNYAMQTDQATRDRLDRIETDLRTTNQKLDVILELLTKAART